MCKAHKAHELREPNEFCTAVVMLVYLAANLDYYPTLSAAEIRGSNAVAAPAVHRTLGPVAANTLSLLILVSILGSLNGLIRTGPRVNYAMAQDGVFPMVIFGQRSRWHSGLSCLE